MLFDDAAAHNWIGWMMMELVDWLIVLLMNDWVGWLVDDAADDLKCLVDDAADDWVGWLMKMLMIELVGLCGWCCWCRWLSWLVDDELVGWWLSWLVDEQERLMKKLGANAYPFFFELPPHCPASVTLQPAPGDTGEVTVASSCNRSLRYGRSGCDSCYVEVFHFLSQKPHYRYPAYAIL